MTNRFCRAVPAAAVVVLAGLTLGAEQAAQSLGDVARKEAERRQRVQSGHVYTNGDLLPVDPATPSSQPAPPVPPVDAETDQKSPPVADKAIGAEKAETPAGALLKPRETRPEQYWRKNARTLRADLAEAERNLAQMETRLKELDASEQTAALVRERAITEKALSELQLKVRYRRDALSRFEAFAQSLKVPAEWIQ